MFVSVRGSSVVGCAYHGYHIFVCMFVFVLVVRVLLRRAFILLRAEFFCPPFIVHMHVHRAERRAGAYDQSI